MLFQVCMLNYVKSVKSNNLELNCDEKDLKIAKGDNFPHSREYPRTLTRPSWPSDLHGGCPDWLVRHTRPARRVAVLASKGPAAAVSGVARFSSILCACEHKPMPARHASQFFLHVVIHRHLSLWALLGLTGVSFATAEK